jgi:hypothetical protein
MGNIIIEHIALVLEIGNFGFDLLEGGLHLVAVVGREEVGQAPSG